MKTLLLAYIMLVCACSTQQQTANSSQSAQMRHPAAQEHREEQKAKEKVWDSLDGHALTFSSFLSDYEQNEIAADEHYKGKRLELTAINANHIEKIGRDIRGKPYVIFHTPKRDLRIQAFFTSESRVKAL